MAGSLSDQLLKAGLVDQKKAKKARHEVRKNRKQARQGKAVTADTGGEALEQSVEAQRRAKAERDRELNRERNAEAQRLAMANEVRQLITGNRVAREPGDVRFNFQDGSVIRTLHLSASQRDALVAGSLAIAALDDGYELVPGPVAARLSQRQPESVKYFETSSKREPTEGAGEDDPYAGYEVPDDLQW